MTLYTAVALSYSYANILKYPKWRWRKMEALRSAQVSLRVPREDLRSSKSRGCVLQDDGPLTPWVTTTRTLRKFRVKRVASRQIQTSRCGSLGL
jgi:hypothetical protein